MSRRHLPEHSDTRKERLEQFLDRRLKLSTCATPWQYARVKEVKHCGADNSSVDDEEAVEEKKGDESNFHDKMKTIRQKYLKTRKYLQEMEAFSSQFHLKLLKQPYLNSKNDNQIPPWLMGVLEKGLCITLIPLLPPLSWATRETQALVCSNYDANVLRKLEFESSFDRRVTLRINGNHKYSRLHRPHEYFPELVVCEEVSGCSLSFSPSDLENLKLSMRQNIATATQADMSAEWTEEFSTKKASVEESNEGRVMVTGMFECQDNEAVEFKVILFPGERTSSSTMRLYGTYIRNIKGIPYNLRWKYDIEIPALKRNMTTNDYSLAH